MPKHYVSLHIRRQLYRSISSRVGFPIRNKLDCLKVSELIHQSGFPAISESTLYRFFLWEKNTHVPYIHTLDTIARFCGFSSFKDFENYQFEIDRFTIGFGKIPAESEREIPSLLHWCIRMNEMQPLFSFAEQIPTTVAFDKKIALGEELFFALKSNPTASLHFFKNFAKLPIIRESLFELWADPNFTINGYEKGLIYYLEGLNPNEKIRDLQDFVFANCLLYRHYYLTNRTDDAKNIAHELFVKRPLELNERDTIHIFPVGRYFACRLLHFHLEKQCKEMDSFWDELKEWMVTRIPCWDREQQQIIFFNLAEAALFISVSGDRIARELKELFAPILRQLPAHLANADLKDVLPYIDKNSAIIVENQML